MKTLISRLKSKNLCHIIDKDILILSVDQNNHELTLETIHLKTKHEENFCLPIQEAFEALLLPNDNFLTNIEGKKRIISSKPIDKLQRILKNHQSLKDL